jgi:hypothetical protein
MSRTLPQPGRPEDLLRHVGPQTDVILPLANGEPVGLMDTLEEHADALEGLRAYQMHAAARAALHPRRVRRSAAPRLLLPVGRDARGVLGRLLRPRAEPLLRDVAAAGAGRRAHASAPSG